MKDTKALGHIKETCLYIQDLDQAEAFYHGKLGLPIISRIEGRHIFFRAGTSVLLCFIPEVTKKEEKLPAHFAYGKQHLAFGIGKKDYAYWKSKMKEAGIPITCEREWKNGLYSFYFEDPEGHVLEIIPNEVWDG